MNATLAKSNVAGILTGWREIENHLVASAAARLSENAVKGLIADGYLKPLARGPQKQIRIRAADLDRAWRAREAARALARERYGQHRRGGLSDRLAALVHASTRPNSRVRRIVDERAQAQQMGLFVQEGGAK